MTTCDLLGPFSGFGAERYVPVLVALAVVRTIAPHLAFLVPLLIAVAGLHRHGEHQPDAPIQHSLGTLILAATVLAIDPLTCAAGIGTSTILVATDADMASALDHLNRDDIAFNVAATAARAFVVLCTWPFVGPRVRGGAGHLVRKLLVVGIGATVVSWPVGAGLLAFGRWMGFGDVSVDANSPE